MVWALSSNLFQPMLTEWGGVEWESLLRVLSLWPGHGCHRYPHLCSSSPCREAGGGQQILHSALIKDLFPPLLLLLLCAIPGKEDWTWQGSESRRIRDQEKVVPFCHSWLLPALLGSSASTLQGRLGYKDPRAKSLIGEKKTKEKSCSLL